MLAFESLDTEPGQATALSRYLARFFTHLTVERPRGSTASSVCIRANWADCEPLRCNPHTNFTKRTRTAEICVPGSALMKKDGFEARN
jgi:hypothetical protein